MTKFLLGKCCFCVNLRLGCLILGYLGLIINIIEIIMPAVVIGQLTAYILDTRDYYPPSRVNIFIPSLTLNAASALVACTSLIFDIILLIGLHKHKPKLVKAYLISAVVFLVVLLILLIAVCVLSRLNLVSVLTRIALILFNVYMIITTRSYYYRMPQSTGDAQTTAQSA